MSLSRQHPLAARLRADLAARGVSTAAELCARLGVSQPTFSRLVRRMPEVVRIGAGRATRWGLRHFSVDLPEALPLYRIGLRGRPIQVATLRVLQADQVAVSAPDGSRERVVDDLPWFLEDARPTGFLGRLAPRRHPELSLPPDILRWTTVDVLRFLALRGGDLPGDLVLGEAALARALSESDCAVVAVGDRASRYPEIAADVLAQGGAGSSAAGEHAKFLAIRRGPDGDVPVLVKFSPPIVSRTSERVADLLVCEHLACQILLAAGIDASRTSIVTGGGRLFLEVERFDRTGPGRRGVVSLATLDAEFGGTATDWVTATTALARGRRVPAELVERVRALHTFGQLIANSDMHTGNLSFWRVEDPLVDRGLVATDLTPVYDMLPMAFAPRAGELIHVQPALPAPLPNAERAHELAVTFWATVRDDERVSRDFRRIAAQWRDRVRAWGRVGSTASPHTR